MCAFLLDDGADLTLIDTLFEIDARLVLEQIGRTNKTVADLKHILLTHAHRFHLGGLAELKRLSGATVYSHEWKADIVAGERKAQASAKQLCAPIPVTWRCTRYRSPSRWGLTTTRPAPSTASWRTETG